MEERGDGQRCWDGKDNSKAARPWSARTRCRGVDTANTRPTPLPDRWSGSSSGQRLSYTHLPLSLADPPVLRGHPAENRCMSDRPT